MIWDQTWPTYTWSDEEATRKLIAQYHLGTLVSFGKTKIFIKTPRTVYYLEEEREKKLPSVVSACFFICLHKFQFPSSSYHLFWCICEATSIFATCVMTMKMNFTVHIFHYS